MLHARDKTILERQISKQWSVTPPGNKVSADIEEDEEALVIRRECTVGTQAPPLLPQTLQVDDVQVNLLSDGGRGHRI